jgi:hypothetical protein
VLGWVNKKLKITMVRNLLAQHGCAGVYPDAVLRDIVDRTFEMTKLLMEDSFSGLAFDFDGNWNFYLSPYIKLLTLNALVEYESAQLGPDQLAECVRMTILRNPNAVADVDSFSVNDMEGILRRNGCFNHMGAVWELVSA